MDKGDDGGLDAEILDVMAIAEIGKGIRGRSMDDVHYKQKSDMVTLKFRQQLGLSSFSCAPLFFPLRQK